MLKKIGLGMGYIEGRLKKDKIDIAYFLSPSPIPQFFSEIPYIFTLWDLGHLDNLEFLEISGNRQFELREEMYQRSLKKAFKVVTESSYGKRNAEVKYNLDSKRVAILKFLPSMIEGDKDFECNIKEIYNLKNDYIFYPAQFWSHKNHIYILEAIRLLKELKGIELDVIFSGSDQGNLNYILDRSKELGVEHLIHFVGFVPDEEIPYLYKQSISLVMPTYLGPTNIPPLEALHYEIPVCYSDLACFREQTKDAVFYMDLNDPNSLVECLLDIINNENEVKDKRKAGKRLLSSWSEENFYRKLMGILKEYQYIRKRWN
jgi:glycosyltransferase involved in cell wall biosynthesis